MIEIPLWPHADLRTGVAPQPWPVLDQGDSQAKARRRDRRACACNAATNDDQTNLVSVFPLNGEPEA